VLAAFPPMDFSSVYYNARRAGFAFAELKNVDLHSTPMTLQLADSTNSFDTFFPNTVMKLDSKFKHAFLKKSDMYMLTMMGFTDEELAYLFEKK
jgi:hypothetical protein